MKKSISVFLAGILLLIVLNNLAAQENEKDIFAKTVAIYKILAHELGYKILYYRVEGGLGEIYLPFSWFNSTAGPAYLIWGKDLSYPYFSVYWEEGEFSFIKIYVRDNFNDPSWGSYRKTFDEAKANFDVTPENFEIKF